MPMIEYKCECGNKFEGYVPKMSQVHPTRMCPKCHKDAPKVEISRPARRNPAFGIQR